MFRALARLLPILAALSLLAGALPAHAQSRDCVRTLSGETVCPPARTQCMAERDNPAVIKCSPVDGGIAPDFYGKPVCGAGSCVRDLRSETYCSRTPAGAAALSINGEAVCTGGCVKASASLCTSLQR